MLGFWYVKYTYCGILQLDVNAYFCSRKFNS